MDFAVNGPELLYHLWGKTNEREAGDKEFWRSHPALCHMIDVGHVAEVWLKCHSYLLDQFVRLTGNRVERGMLKRIIVAVAALHDLGKIHPYFQAKSSKGWRSGYGKVGIIQPVGTGFDHGFATARIIRDLVESGAEEGEKWEPYRAALTVAAGHHGRLYENEWLEEDDTERYPPLNSSARRIALEALDLVAELFGLPEKPPASSVLMGAGFLMLLAGFVSVADWIGSALSSEILYSPICYFVGNRMRSRENARCYLHSLRKSGKAEQMLRDAGLLPRFRCDQPTFPSLFPEFIATDDDIRPLQREVQTVPFGSEPGPELALVEGPMGTGKTEIALYLAARALQAEHAGGLYFALPTQASANALLVRVLDFARHIGGDAALALGLAHGARDLSVEYGKLRQAAQRLALQMEEARVRGFRDSTDEAVPAEVVAPDWLQSSKRTLLAPVGLGTVDQAMLGAICVRHAFVRLYALAGKVVVFDEIHAYDAYMYKIIEHLLKWLHALGSKVILLSATLPRSLRAKLFTAYGVSQGSAVLVSSEGSPETDPYPQILYACDGKMASPVVLTAEESEQNSAGPAQISLHPHAMPHEERTKCGVARALDLARQGGCVAWIRNTVKEAHEAWLCLHDALQHVPEDERAELELLHARFLPPHRSAIEEDLIAQLGKPERAQGRRSKRLIVVATQVIEQSVDVDFDAMISDLAPLDLLLQRAGRLWRHNRDERHDHTQAALHVLLPTPEERRALRFGPSGLIYDVEILARSAVLLEEAAAEGGWRLPKACRMWVSRLYDDELRWTAESIGADPDRLETVRRKRRENEGMMKGRAELALLSDPRWPGPPEMRAARRDASDESGSDVALATRYGGENITVTLLHQKEGTLRLLGDGTTVRVLPDKKEKERALALDQAVRRSSLSFPWFGSRDKESLRGDSPGLEQFAAWWRERHPHDARIFLLTSSEGKIEHPQFIARYRVDAFGRINEGFVFVRAGRDLPPSPFDSEEL